MKSNVKIVLAAGLLIINSAMFSQAKKDSLGLPGDNFDLYGALELFKQSSSPEAFEKAINSPDNAVNNLDLDANGKVDYVKVVDKSKGDAHSLVMQVAVSKTELQDVAVIEVEKTSDGNAHLQIIGDEDLYGKNYIVEPKEATDTKQAQSSSKPADGATDDVYNTSPNTVDNSNNSGNSNNNVNSNNYNYAGNGYANSGPQVMVNVWGWPSVQFMYGPAYVGWSSPWSYGYYPGWFQPWPPIYWGVYYRRMYQYHYPYFQRAYQYRCMTAHNYYYGMRSSSGIVRHYNRGGVYRQRQMAYRNNTVHGSRYNAMPAHAGRAANSGVEQRARQNNVKVQPRNTVSPRAQQPRANPSGIRQPEQARSQPRQVNGARGNTAPQQIQQPRHVNTQPEQIRAQPQHVNTQPRQMNTQPREVGRPQGGAPGGGGGGHMSVPHGGGGGGMGGGGHRGR